jgi:hypothetical protein
MLEQEVLSTEEIRKQAEKKRKEGKLQQALQNNLHISNLNLPNKFRSFESWELAKSKRLLFEISREKNTYRRFPRGSIVKVDFGVNIGGEFSEQHFAITLNKKDNMYNNILTVIPLTSKKHNDSISLKSLIVDMYLESLEKESKELTKEINNSQSITAERSKEFLERIDDIKKILDYYSTLKDNFSYALVNQIRTVSKLNVLPPINKYDIVNSAICSEGAMIKIDKAIVKKFVDLDYIAFENWYDEQKNS